MKKDGKNFSNYCKCGHTYGDHGYSWSNACSGSYRGIEGEWRLCDDGKMRATIVRWPCVNECKKFEPIRKSGPRQNLTDVTKQCSKFVYKLAGGKAWKRRCRNHPYVNTQYCKIHNKNP